MRINTNSYSLVLTTTLFISLTIFANEKNSLTKYKSHKPDGVCFEESTDRYRIKKKHSISNLMNYFELRPLYCKDCSIETAQNINKLENVDYILPGQILIIPKKCPLFSWNDTYDYSKIRKSRANDIGAKKIMESRSQKTKLLDSENTIKNNQKYSNLKDTNNSESKGLSPYDFAKNNLNILPLVLYKEIKVSSSEIKAFLKSNLGTGIYFSYDRYQSEKSVSTISSSFYKIKIMDELDAKININDSDLSFFNVTGSYKIILNSIWSLSTKFSLKENLFAYKNDNNSIRIEKSRSTIIGVIPNYNLYFKDNLKIYIDTELSLILPQNTYYGQTTHGYSANLNLGANYGLENIQLITNLQYNLRNQKTKETITSEYEYLYSLGFSYDY